MDQDTATSLTQVLVEMIGIVKDWVDAATATYEQVKGIPAAEAVLSNSLGQSLGLGSRLLKVQEKALGLQRENDQFREEIRRDQEWKAERLHFKRKKLSASVVMVDDREDELMHFCPACLEKGHLAMPLHLATGGHAGEVCPNCHELYPR